MTYYSAYDMQTGVMSARRNYTDKEKLIEEIFLVLWEDTDDPEADPNISVPKDERYEYIEVFGGYNIVEHDEKIEEY